MGVTIPKKWDNIELRKFVHYCEYIDEKPETIEERFELIYKKACALLDISYAEAKQLTVKEQAEVTKLASSKMPMYLKRRFKLNGVNYRPIGSKDSIVDVRELDGNRYSAIKALAKKGTSENLHQILYLVCEPIRWGFKPTFPFLGYSTYEMNTKAVEQGINDFKNLPMSVANPLIVFFDAIKEVERPFKRLFNPEVEWYDEPDEGGTSGFRERYGWITVIDAMSGGDPTKWEYFGKMKVVPFLQMCMYYQDKQRDIKRQRKEQELKHKR